MFKELKCEENMQQLPLFHKDYQTFFKTKMRSLEKDLWEKASPYNIREIRTNIFDKSAAIIFNRK